MTHDQSGQSLRSHFLVLISSLSGLLHELRSVLDFKFTIPSIVIQSLIIDFLFYLFIFLSFFFGIFESISHIPLPYSGSLATHFWL